MNLRLEKVIFFGLLAIVILSIYGSGFFDQFMSGYESVKTSPSGNFQDLILYTGVFMAWYVGISMIYYTIYRIHRIFRLRKLAKEHGFGAEAMKLEPSEEEAEEELEKLEQP